MSEERLMSKKKPAYPVNKELDGYLANYNRKIEIPIFYDDLLRFSGSVVVYNSNDEDTLWIRVYYSEFDRQEIDDSLKKVYSILHSDGSENINQYLNVDAVDFCTFGNSKPFRIKIRNILNDNFTYFYIKKTDASRIYGLELEHMLSPYNLNFLVYKDTLIEEHIAGIPGDEFIRDMHRPQFFKENYQMVELVRAKLLRDSVDQYKLEERSIVAKRILSSGNRIKKLRAICKKDIISTNENIETLREQILELTQDMDFKKCNTMGEVLDLALNFVRRNYEDVSMKQIIEQNIKMP